MFILITYNTDFMTNFTRVKYVSKTIEIFSLFYDQHFTSVGRIFVCCLLLTYYLARCQKCLKVVPLPSISIILLVFFHRRMDICY